MDKPLVFISHITQEKEIAVAFKELVEKSFLGMLEVFVSSDEDSIKMGHKWLDQISDGLKKCSIEIILCSTKSITRPWINFEAGAGWVRDINVIPLCHSGMEPSKLPMPLNLLQAAKANEISSLKLIFPVLANAINAKVPNVDFSEFIEIVTEFEVRYTFWDECNQSFNEINNFNNGIIPELKKGNNIELKLTETQINLIQKPIEFLRKNNILSLDRTGSVLIGSGGMMHGCILKSLSDFSKVIVDKNFIF